LPIIATDLESLRELIHDGKNGILIPPKDSYSLKEAMSKFIFQKDLLIKLRNENFRISRFYSDKYVLNKFIRIVESLK